MTQDDSTEQLRETVATMSSAQKRLLIERLRQAGLATPLRGGRLVAFYQSVEPLNSDDLRDACNDKLPAHMVPQQFVHQESLALTSTGKLDRNGMRARLWSASAVTAALDADVTTARNDVEEVLAEIWCDVLGIDEISVFDNFFEVGGDSLQVIRILSRASKAGLSIKPDAIFAYPTIAELAQHADAKEDEPAVVVDAHGPLPLLPIQSWFFNVVGEYQHHWNQSYLFALSQPVETQRLVQIVGKLLEHHDALRSTFHHESGVWKSRIEQAQAPAVRAVSLQATSDNDKRAEMRTVADEENANVDLSIGPLFRVVHFLEAGGPGYLGLIAHHLVVDAVSWQVLTGDLQLLLASGSLDRALSAKPASIKRWAERLEQFSARELGDATGYWIQQASAVEVKLPGSSETGNTEGSCLWLSRRLEKKVTGVLRAESVKKLRASIQEIVLSALVQVIARWTGGERITFDLEGHGRESLFESVDVSQTVGWCTSVFPVTFSAASNGDWFVHRDALRLVKEQLRAVPHNGMSHGLVQHMGPDSTARNALGSSPRSQLLFNYLGREDHTTVPNAPITLIDPRFGAARHFDCRRAYKLELNAVIRHDELVVDWAYCPDIHATDVVSRLADELMVALKELVGSTEESGTSVITPTDFPMAGLDQSALDSLSSQLDGLDDDLDDD